MLEFANLQLLEARFLDAALDRALDRSYQIVSQPRRLGALGPTGWSRRDLARIGRFEVEGAILFERVGNAIKLLGDQYLARVHRAASQRFRLAEWNAAILRKLETIESLYREGLGPRERRARRGARVDHHRTDHVRGGADVRARAAAGLVDYPTAAALRSGACPAARRRR